MGTVGVCWAANCAGAVRYTLHSYCHLCHERTRRRLCLQPVPPSPRSQLVQVLLLARGRRRRGWRSSCRRSRPWVPWPRARGPRTCRTFQTPCTWWTRGPPEGCSARAPAPAASCWPPLGGTGGAGPQRRPGACRTPHCQVRLPSGGAADACCQCRSREGANNTALLCHKC